MKTNLTLLAIALAAVPLCRSAAAPPSPAPLPSTPAPTTQNPSLNPSATKTTEKAIRISNPKPNPKESGKIERAGKMSSRPWTEIVGWHPGASEFATAETAEPQLTLVSLKF